MPRDDLQPGPHPARHGDDLSLDRPGGEWGFGNYLIPFYVGASDMAFPRLNAVAFWLIPPAGLLLISSYFITGAAQSGWTAYPPLSITTPASGQIIWILSVLLLGAVPSLAASISSPHSQIAPAWTEADAAADVLLGHARHQHSRCSIHTSSGRNLVLLSFDIVAHTGFFNPGLGGNAVVYQHLFWFYSHPAVYIMVLPAFGLVSEILPDALPQAPVRLHNDGVFDHGIVILGLSFGPTTCSPAARLPGCACSSPLPQPLLPYRRASNSLTGWPPCGEGESLNSAVLFLLRLHHQLRLGGITGVLLPRCPSTFTCMTPTSWSPTSTTSSTAARCL
jgi:cytochrome c oxidase subunit 1